MNQMTLKIHSIQWTTKIVALAGLLTWFLLSAVKLSENCSVGSQEQSPLKLKLFLFCMSKGSHKFAPASLYPSPQHSLKNSRTFQDLALKFLGLSTNWKFTKKSRTFQDVCEPCINQCYYIRFVLVML